MDTVDEVRYEMWLRVDHGLGRHWPYTDEVMEDCPDCPNFDEIDNAGRPL